MKTPVLSIIVPSRSGRLDFLKAQLSQQTFKNWELIISAGHPSPTLARNQGGLQANCPFLLFLDDDVHLSHKTFLSKIMESLLSIAPLSVLGVEWKVPPDASEFQKKIHNSSFTEPHNPREPLRVVPWLDTVAGSCMAMRKDTFDALGGFDERLISGGDPDFFYRVWRRGGKMYFLSSVWVYHYPPSTPKILFKKTLWYARGNAQVAKKHPESNYRPVLKNWFHAAMLLSLHTAALIPLVFIKISFHYRKPVFCFRPFAALLTYLGFWVYCLSWFKEPALSKEFSISPIKKEETLSSLEEALV